MEASPCFLVEHYLDNVKLAKGRLFTDQVYRRRVKTKDESVKDRSQNGKGIVTGPSSETLSSYSILE